MVVYAIIFMEKQFKKRCERFTENGRTRHFELSQHIPVRLYDLSYVQEVARGARYFFDHTHFLSGEYFFFDGMETNANGLYFVLHRFIDLLHHVKEQKAGVITDRLLIQDRINFENF